MLRIKNAELSSLSLPRRSQRLKDKKNKLLPVNARPSRRYLPRRSQRLRDQKKKLLTKYVKQIPSVLDNLPMHVIQYQLFPYLDYNSRNNLNMCLPPWDRVRTRMPPESIKKHHFDYCVNVIASILNSLEEKEGGRWIYEGDERLQRLIQMLNLFLKDDYFQIYENSEGFRRTLSTKILEIQTTLGPQDHLFSRVWVNELLLTCELVRNKIYTYNEGEKRPLLHIAPPLKFT